ncbi:hypothetical protein ACFP1L_08440 [Lactiplantibacillus nangangensis]|uniref:Uncharacterized protein n=1 Tax=Lactiplantibacillus nangangensis TaxID=2559917 RepID=A0ABW1SKV7_9LACO|nr:hypothetical protein [Lactiplantibacillus nangangensis]
MIKQTDNVQRPARTRVMPDYSVSSVTNKDEYAEIIELLNDESIPADLRDFLKRLPPKSEAANQEIDRKLETQITTARIMTLKSVSG